MIPAHVRIGALVMALMMLGLIGAKLYSNGYRNGRNAVLVEIEAANREAARKADEAARKLNDCPLDQWNRETGRCER